MADDEHTPVLEAPSPAPAPAAPDPATRNNRGNMTRNLNVEPDEVIAKKMFLGGLLLLPWLHFVTVVFYRKQLMDPSINPQVTKWVRWSLIAAMFTTVLFIAWAVLFQIKWKDFGWAKLVMVLPPQNLDVGW